MSCFNARPGLRNWLTLLLLVSACAHASSDQPVLSVGSKTFGESYILAEMAAQLLESDGYEVERKLGLGGTLIAFEALKAGAIDVYPEYTGTLTEAVYHQQTDRLAKQLAGDGLQLLTPIGFNNSYALAMSRSKALDINASRISDLVSRTDLVIGFSLEFLNRGDGWPSLQSRYALPQQPKGIEHALAYSALARGQLDVTDAYTTDGDIESFDLVLLEDDLDYFPRYEAALLVRQDLPEKAAIALEQLAGLIDETTMQSLNAALSGGEKSAATIANGFLVANGLLRGNSVPLAQETTSASILRHTLTHLKLTGLALLLACTVALPLALVLTRYPRGANTLLYVTGLIQTVPSLAMLALLIPLVGLGQVPAVIALFLYSLLPIVRNTITGIFGVDPLLRQVAVAMGLSARERLTRIEIPLAAPVMLAGIKTAAVISVGTATLAAFVGAGGLGEPIITGLSLNNHALILQGALPAAGLAIAVELLFEGLERALIPRHLRSGGDNANSFV